jgi:integrase
VDLTQRHQTITELVELWLQRGLPTSASPGTRANYATVLRTHLQPALGEARADDLTVEHVEALLDGMAERGYAASTIRLTLSLLKRVLTFGQRRGVVLRNVADLARPPAAPTKPRDALTVEQARLLLQACRSERYRPLITLSLLLGLRPSEATGLTSPHVHLDTDPATLTVEHSLRRQPDRTLTLTQPKTASSRRTLALPRPASPPCATSMPCRTRTGAPPAPAGPTRSCWCSPPTPADRSTPPTCAAPWPASPTRPASGTSTPTSCPRHRQPAV